jgi:formylglycine-generating enzyme required for sulfatase activity
MNFLVPRLLFFAVLAALMADALAQADKIVPGAQYSMERLDPLMPPNLYTGPAPEFAAGVESVAATQKRARNAELPAGCRLLSEGCKVTSSDPKPSGDLQRLTDGDRRDDAAAGVQLAVGRQWVQLELAERSIVHCIWIWRSHREPVVFQEVKVEVATSPEGPWETVFNTNAKECCGTPDPLHMELSTGFPVIVRGGTVAVYVRLWSAGSDKFPENRYLEVSVYGRHREAPPADLFRPVEGGKEKLEPAMPRPWFTMSPHGPPPGDNVENGKDTRERKDKVFLPPGCRLLSLHCPVKVSDPALLGEPEMVTDGIRTAENMEFIDMAPGKQWVRIDLGASREIHCVWLWLRDRLEVVAYHDVIIQVSDDLNFYESTTVFNNDHDNSSSVGKGTDKEWEEMLYGRPVTFPPVNGRFVRVMTNGRSLDDTNHFTEVAVYGKDALDSKSGQTPAPAAKKDSHDNLELVQTIHHFILERSVEKEPAQMKVYTGTRSLDDVKFDMVPIPAGEFLMGSPETETGRKPDEGPQIRVKIEPFWMGAREVTWDEYKSFVYRETPMWKKDGEKTKELSGKDVVDAVTGPSVPYVDPTFGMGEKGRPAISMTEHSALKYCQWLSAQTGHFYRLPTEAEWEYAARAGTRTGWFWGADEEKLKDFAWYFDNSEVNGMPVTHPVGQKKPSPWGLYDIYGNVAEWTLDQYAADWYAREAARASVHDNPFHKPVTRYPRTVRGGSWDDYAADCRSASRGASRREWKQQDPASPKSLWQHTNAQTVGFRIVRPLKVPSAAEMHEIWNLGAVGEEK